MMSGWMKWPTGRLAVKNEGGGREEETAGGRHSIPGIINSTCSG